MAVTLNPFQFFRRKQKTDNFCSSDIKIPQDEGYVLFGPEVFPSTRPLIAECQEIFAHAKNSGAMERKTNTVGKAFLIKVTESPQELLLNPVIRKFILSNKILSPVVDYFGAVPILSHIHLLWSPPNDSNLKSQQYHYDTEDTRQIKLFINIADVTDECGPFTFIGRKLSGIVRNLTGHAGGRWTRLDDQLVTSSINESDQIVATGSAGGGIFVDTSRCLHFGSRGNTKERLVLMIQFLNYYAPKTQPVDWSEASATFSDELDPTQRLVLRC